MSTKPVCVWWDATTTKQDSGTYFRVAFKIFRNARLSSETNIFKTFELFDLEFETVSGKKKINNSYHWTYPFCTIQKQHVFGKIILKIQGDKNFTLSYLVELKKSHEIFSLLPFSGTLVSNVVNMMGTVDPTMVSTAQLVEHWRLTEWLPCGRKTNGRGGLVPFTAGTTLRSSVRGMMVTVVQIMVPMSRVLERVLMKNYSYTRVPVVNLLKNE